MILSAGLMMTPAGVAYEMGLGEKDVPDSVHNRPRMVGGVSGASMLARTEIFRKFGGFDEGYFAFCEDLDLCWRLNLMDHKVFYEPRSVVYHWSGGTAGGNTSKTRVYFMQKNMIRTALKNFGFLNLVKALLIAVFYTLFRTLLYAFTLRFDLVNAAWSGSLVILRDLRQVLAQRKIIQKTRIVSDRQLKVRGWISSPWDAACEFYRTRRFFCARQR
jgi:GT2 family glycosyltransferase